MDVIDIAFCLSRTFIDEAIFVLNLISSKLSGKANIIKKRYFSIKLSNTSKITLCFGEVLYFFFNLRPFHLITTLTYVLKNIFCSYFSKSNFGNIYKAWKLNKPKISF